MRRVLPDGTNDERFALAHIFQTWDYELNDPAKLGIVPGSLIVPAARDDREPDCHRWLVREIDAFRAGASELCRYGLGVEFRDAFRLEYAFAIPTAEAISAIVANSPGGLIDFGAGKGYWSYLLATRGLDVLAYDHRPPPGGRNIYYRALVERRHVTETDFRTWHPILYGGAPALQRCSAKRNLLLCWPPHRHDMASQALAAFRGEWVFFVGEFGDGCTGDEEFFQALEADFDLEQQIAIPQFMGLHDGLYMCRRKR